MSSRRRQDFPISKTKRIQILRASYQAPQMGPKIIDLPKEILDTNNSRVHKVGQS